jgi:hypothetical protein
MIGKVDTNKHEVMVFPQEEINNLVKESLDSNFYLYLWNSDDLIDLLLNLVFSNDL